MVEKHGVSAAVDSLAPDKDELPEYTPAEQLALLPLAPRVVEDGEEIPVARRGPGRPPGATNKRTKQWSEYLLSRYRSPLVVLAEIYSRPIEELAKQLGCDKLEAFKAQAAAAVALAPYIHQKMPMEVQIDERKGLYLVLPDPDQMTASVGDIDGELRIGVQLEGECDEIEETG